MTTEAITLTGAILLGVFHTLLGPDHYIPFIVLSKVRKWSLTKTILLVLACGAGHVISSIAIGSIGIAYGWGLTKVELLDGHRGSLAGWSMILFGLTYTLWGIWRIYNNRPHKHTHLHKDGNTHLHEHTHVAGHDHIHNKKLTPWLLFVIFVLGPCESMISLFAFHTANRDPFSVIGDITAFSVATMLTMLVVVVAAYYGLKSVRFGKMETYAHAIAGGLILLSGLLIEFVGL